MRDEPVSIHEKLIAFRFAAEDRMVIEDEAGLAFARLLLKSQGRGQSADAATHDDAIVGFSGVDHVGRKTLKEPISNLMSSFENSGGVAIGICVVADATVSGPIVGHPTVGRELQPDAPLAPGVVRASRQSAANCPKPATKRSRNHAE